MKYLVDSQSLIWFVDQDQLIIAQAITAGFPVISSDDIFDKYGIRRIW